MDGYFDNFDSFIKADIYKYLGSFLKGGKATFRVWAPNAEKVSVVGDFNGWDPDKNPMERGIGGVFEAVVSGVKDYDAYKYAITGGGKTVLKSDPVARHYETSPNNASKVYKDKNTSGATKITPNS